ncbi:MAG: hypothetical protein RIC29_06650 [Rhodospirillaceae bacterium]
MSDVKTKIIPPRPKVPEDEEPLMAKMPKKTGLMGRLLPTGLSRAVVISTLILSATLWTQNLYSARYDLVASGKSETTFMYRLDRWTGIVSLCTTQSCKPLSTIATSPQSAPVATD